MGGRRCYMEDLNLLYRGAGVCEKSPPPQEIINLEIDSEDYM